VEALNAGAIAYLEKPFEDMNTVEGTLEVLIHKQELRERKRDHMRLIRDRNREFLRRYKSLRQDLERRISRAGASED
jgi:FixJ family two-component response regulator